MPADNVTNVRYGAVSKLTVDSSAASAAINSGMARVVASVDSHFTIAETPVATTDHNYLPAGAIEFIRIPPGHKVAMIKAAGASAGIGTVTECHNP